MQSFSLCNGDKGHYRKTANPFSIFRTSALALIKRVSYAITNFFGEKLMKRPSTEKEAKERGDELLETQVSCVYRNNRCHHIEIAEINEHYLEFVYFVRSRFAYFTGYSVNKMISKRKFTIMGKKFYQKAPILFPMGQKQLQRCS